MNLPRLNQYLVLANLAASRRKADELIKSGQVSVNGQKCLELSLRVGEADKVMVGKRNAQNRQHIYIAYNKPRGEVCSHRKQGKAKTIFEHLPKAFSSLKIAGRLDKDSRGIVILSSDGNFVNSLSHPSKGKLKTYRVSLKEDINEEQLKKLNQGVKLTDGMSLLRAKKIATNELIIRMYEGKNRQIRRSLQAVNSTVIDLERTAIAGFKLNIKEGEYVFIDSKEFV